MKAEVIRVKNRVRVVPREAPPPEPTPRGWEDLKRSVEQEFRRFGVVDRDERRRP